MVVQLTGGNDGLNTVVPYTSASTTSSAQAGDPEGDVLKIDDSLGFAPSLKGFSRLLEAGELAIVQGVGYPDPNRSHFEIDGYLAHLPAEDRSPGAGWLGRYLESLKSSDVAAMHVGSGKQPLALDRRDRAGAVGRVAGAVPAGAETGGVDGGGAGVVEGSSRTVERSLGVSAVEHFVGDRCQ